MVVIARFPRLDPTATAACASVFVVTMAPATAAATVTPYATVPVTRRSRVPRARFPAVSTLVLAVVAGMFWAAVWREEQRRATEDGESDREAVAIQPDGEAGLIR